MRKSYLSVIVLIVVLFVGCDSREKGVLLPIKVESGMTLLKIERCLKYNPNPHLTILAKQVIFDYNQRLLVVEGLINIAGNDGGVVDWVVPATNIKDNNLIINIPTDSDYNVQIGDTRFYIPFIKK